MLQSENTLTQQQPELCTLPRLLPTFSIRSAKGGKMKKPSPREPEPQQNTTLWEQPTPKPAAPSPPAPEQAAPAPLAPEIQQLIDELAALTVEYCPQEPYNRCGCPITLYSAAALARAG